jgi:hypothetical protein
MPWRCRRACVAQVSELADYFRLRNHVASTRFVFDTHSAPSSTTCCFLAGSFHGQYTAMPLSDMAAKVPAEVLRHIFVYLRPLSERSLRRCVSVCRGWKVRSEPSSQKTTPHVLHV